MDTLQVNENMILLALSNIWETEVASCPVYRVHTSEDQKKMDDSRMEYALGEGARREGDRRPYNGIWEKMMYEQGREEKGTQWKMCEGEMFHAGDARCFICKNEKDNAHLGKGYASEVNFINAWMICNFNCDLYLSNFWV